MSRNDLEPEVKLTPAQLKVISAAATAAAIEAYRKEAEKEREENRDKRLYNTKLLLEKYRGLKKYSEDAVYDATQLDDDDELKSIVEAAGLGRDSYSMTVDSIRDRVAKTRLIMDHVTRMLEYYEYRCVSSGKPELIRKWEIIKSLYLDEDELTVQELAEKFHVDERTVYRYHKTAIQDISALLFGCIE